MSAPRQPPLHSLRARLHTSSPSLSGRPRDIDVFLASYPSQADDPTAIKNLEFYRNQRQMQPEGLTYEDFMRRYSRDYVELEDNHGYIQWLFPIRERGVNYLAQPLQAHEIDKMSADPEVKRRLLRSYEMMLAFYGIDFNAGRLQRSADWEERFHNLSSHSHNLLRLTRILKHLSEFPALQSHAAPLVLFFVAQHSEGHLDFGENTMRGNSMERWWSNCFRDEAESREVREIVLRRGERGEVVWGERHLARWLDAKTGRG